MTGKWHVKLGIWSDRAGGIIAWEPFFVCLAGLLLAIEFDEGVGTYFSVSVSFDLMPTFAVLLLAWITLTGFNAFAWKTVLQRYDPFLTSADGDKGGPYCTCDRQCCRCLCDSFKSGDNGIQINTIPQDQQDL